MKIDVPQGWTKVEWGSVQEGDMIFIPATGKFKLVNDAIISHLGFLDARMVKELVCVVRPDQEILA